MTGQSSVVAGGVWASGSKLVIVGSAFVATTLAVRLLTPYDVGIYFAVLAAVGIAALLGSLGAWMPVTTFLGKFPESARAERRSIVVRGFLITAFGAVAVTFLFLFGSSAAITFVTGSTASVPWWALAGLSTLFVFRDITVNSLRALTDIKSASIAQAIPPVTLSTILLAAWFLIDTPTLTQVLVAVAVSHVVGLGVGIAVLIVRLRRPTGRAAPPKLRSYLSIGIPWLGTSLLVFVLLQAGVLIVSATSGPEEAAIYGTSLRVALLVGIPSGIASAVLPPFIARYWSVKDRSGLENLMRAVATLSGGAAVLATIVTVVIGKPLLTIAFGEFYAAGWGSLVVLSIAYMIDALSGSVGQFLTITGHQRIVFFVLFVGTSVALVAMWVLGNSFGALGVALGSTLGVISVNIILVGIARRISKIRTWASWPPSEAVATLRSVSGRAVPVSTDDPKR